MSTAVMLDQTAGASPRLKARVAGALWLIIIVAASFAEFFVRGGIVVDGDATATATDILAHEPLSPLGRRRCAHLPVVRYRRGAHLI